MATKFSGVFIGNQLRQVAIKTDVSRATSVLIIRELMSV
jgi:hypothetical protein